MKKNRDSASGHYTSGKKNVSEMSSRQRRKLRGKSWRKQLRAERVQRVATIPIADEPEMIPAAEEEPTTEEECLEVATAHASQTTRIAVNVEDAGHLLLASVTTHGRAITQANAAMQEAGRMLSEITGIDYAPSGEDQPAVSMFSYPRLTPSIYDPQVRSDTLRFDSLPDAGVTFTGFSAMTEDEAREMSAILINYGVRASIAQDAIREFNRTVARRSGAMPSERMYIMDKTGNPVRTRDRTAWQRSINDYESRLLVRSPIVENDALHRHGYIDTFFTGMDSSASVSCDPELWATQTFYPHGTGAHISWTSLESAMSGHIEITGRERGIANARLKAANERARRVDKDVNPDKRPVRLD